MWKKCTILHYKVKPQIGYLSWKVCQESTGGIHRNVFANYPYVVKPKSLCICHDLHHQIHAS